MSENSVRYHLLDEIRGFMVLCMILFHGFYLGGFSFGVEFLKELYYFFQPIEPLFAAGFIFICGLCTHFSRSPLKRGLLTLLVAAGVTLVTYVMTFFGINELIWFGILHFLGICLVLSSLIKRVTVKLPASISIAASVLLFLIFYHLPDGYFGIGNLVVDMPRSLYDIGALMPLGMPESGFCSGDYFPLIPWMFVFFAGVFTANKLGGKLPDLFIKSRIKPLSFLGRNALLFYIVHQPVWYAVFYLLSLVGIIK